MDDDEEFGMVSGGDSAGPPPAGPEAVAWEEKPTAGQLMDYACDGLSPETERQVMRVAIKHGIRSDDPLWQAIALIREADETLAERSDWLIEAVSREIEMRVNAGTDEIDAASKRISVAAVAVRSELSSVRSEAKELLASAAKAQTRQIIKGWSEAAGSAVESRLRSEAAKAASVTFGAVSFVVLLAALGGVVGGVLLTEWLLHLPPAYVLHTIMRPR